MPEEQLLLEAGLLLALLALSGALFRWLHLSAIPAFILIGLVLQPLIRESALVRIFGVLGVVLLLFFIGLEFSLSALIAGRRRLLAHGVRDFVLNFPVGFLAGLWLGWGMLGGVLLGSALYISSSAIIARSLIELKRTAFPESEIALGILVFEDLVVALLLALLSGFLLAEGELTTGLVGAARALIFFGAAVLIAIAGRRVLDRLLETEDDDVFLLLVAAAVLILAWAALASGLSEAIGAFLAGTLLGETRHRARIETLFAPLQGLFAAVFFVGFGLAIDTGAFGRIWLAAVLVSLLCILAKLLAGWWSARADGLSRRAALSLGLTLIPRGEFSLVLAGVAAAAGYREAAALIALVVLVLTVVGTVATRHAPRLAQWLLGVTPPAPPTRGEFISSRH